MPVTAGANLHHRLFCKNEFDLYEKDENWEEQGKKLDERRIKAIQDIYKDENLNGIISFAKSVEDPYKVGWALGGISSSEIDVIVFPDLLNNIETQIQQFISGYIYSTYLRKGWSWVDVLTWNKWTTVQRSIFLKYLPFENGTWTRLNKWLGKEEALYWNDVRVLPFQSSEKWIAPAIIKLLEFHRPKAAIECFQHQLWKKTPVDNKLLITALMEALFSNEINFPQDAYHTIDLIKYLQFSNDVTDDDKCQVEWGYLSWLSQNEDTSPKTLEKRLASNPDFFCEVIGIVYRSTKDQKLPEQSDEQKKNTALNAWHLLFDWKTPPGLNDDGSFSIQKFNTWFKIVKDKCFESGHYEVAMTKIGEVLFYCPGEKDDLWINIDIAKILNQKDSEEMRNGFLSGVLNSRGVHLVDPTGKPEKELAILWNTRAQKVEGLQLIRFAELLKKIAKSYESEATWVIDSHNL